MAETRFVEFVVKTSTPMTLTEMLQPLNHIPCNVTGTKEYDPSEGWRPAFEAWVGKQVDDPILLDQTGKYTVSRVQFLWLGWKAARQNA